MNKVFSIFKILKLKKLFVVGLIFFLVVGVGLLKGANRYSVANGNWNLTSTWAATSGGPAGAGIPVAGDVVYIEGTRTVTITANAACTNLSIAGGSTLGIGGFNLAVSGTTTITGTLNFTSLTGTKMFTGLVTVNLGGTWNNSINAPITLLGGITNNGTFTAGTGLYTFNTNNQASTGTLSIPNVTVTGIVLNNNGTLTVGTALSGNGGLTNGTTGSLILGGTSGITTLTATAAGNTVNYSGAAQTIKAIATYHHLTFSGSGVKTLGAATTAINGNFTTAGTASVTGVVGLTIGGDVTLGTGTTFSGGNFTHRIAGNWINNGGVFTPGTGTITMTGAAKTIGGTAPTIFNNLTISNAGGLQLGNNQTVNGTLTLTNGRLTLGANNLTMGITSPAVAGTLSAANMIVTDGVGELRKNLSGNGSYVFPVGEVIGTAEYSPVTVNFTSGTYIAGAYAGARVINAKHPNNASISNYLNRYWIVNQTGITAFSATVTGTFPAADIVGNVANMITGKWSGTMPWQAYGAVTGSTITSNGLTSFGEFTAIEGPTVTVVPTPLTGFNYSVGSGPSAQQSFTVSGSGLGTNIVVTPSANFEVSLTSGVSFVATNPISLAPVSGTVTPTTVYVRLKAGLASGAYTAENVASSTTGTTTQNVACSGNVNTAIEIWKGGTMQSGFLTLKGAFDAINAGTYTGALEIRVNGSTFETASAVLNQSGGTSNYSSISIYPTTTGISVTGNLAAPLIDLNGADNVTIDGSLNALGSAKSLTITNSSTSAIAGTSTIRFINSAENNAVKNCTIKGSETNAAGGVIFFSTATAGNGNDGNTIDNNDISSNANIRPINAVFSAGSALHENSGISILNNNIFDFWNLGANSSAIQLAASSTDFTISKNSFYETTSFQPTGTAAYQMILINNPSGNNFAISDNYFGGQAQLCGGPALSVGIATVQLLTLDVIQLNAGTTTATSVQGNIISNINFRSSNVAPLRAINAVAGALNIGTVTGNTIGSDTGNGNVTVTSTVANSNAYGIYIASSNTVDCQNNTIGSITTANANTNATNLYGIYKTATAGTTTISKNIVGSATVANSLNASSQATAGSQLLYGIYSAGTGNTTISGNTIANITNSTTETGFASAVRGILTVAGSNDINNNEVHHLKSGGAAGGANYANTSLIGISQLGAVIGTTQNITGNAVYNLTNTSIVKMEMYGIYYSGPATGTNAISRNFVHSFFISSTDQAYLHGISLYGGAFIASNNIVFMGDTITTGCFMWAMWTNSNNAIQIYHNTLYLAGIAATGSSNTYAFRSLNAGPTSAVIKNNILWNGRTNSNNVISHFAIYLQSAANTSVDYNDYKFAQQFGLVGAASYATLSAWKAGTGFDANSLETDPQLVNLGGILPIDYQTKVGLPGATGTGIATDYNEIDRSTTAPTMGAWEYFSSPVEVWNGTTFRANYITLKDAFDKINDGTWKGDLIIKFKGNTIENASAVLNASGTGPCSYTNILIYPARLGVTVTGSLAAPLVDLNGSDNVTFDGRKDGAGTTSSITFSNTSASGTPGTSTFRFINDATNNTLKYCTIKGSSTDANGGIIFIGSTTGSTGNDGNTIDNNSITNSTDVNRPVNAISSSGTSAKENSGNVFSNNRIFNFLNKGLASNGLNLGSNTTGETIKGNSFYETTSFVPTAGVTYNVININNTAGVNYSVTGNFIGGSSPLCGGTPWTKTNASDNTFTAINLNAGTAAVSSVQNNTIKNMVWGNSGAASWTGINVLAGSVNLGTSAGNTIGATSATGSIILTGGATGTTVYGINISSPGTVDCQNNIIGSITASNAVANATNIYAINKTVTAGTTTISNNTIGSAVTANSINASSASTGNAQRVYGIYNAGSGTIVISGNTIANLTNATTNTTAGTAGQINGIVSTGGTNTITNNTIRNLAIANANSASTENGSVLGISLTGTTGARIITGNTIYNLSNTYATFAGRVVGIYYNGNTTGTNEVSKNFIHSLTTVGTSGAGLVGIQVVSGVTTYSNNIVSLGNANQNLIYGIYDTGAASQTSKFYFNTIYIGGIVAAGVNNSYAFYCAATNNTRDYRNNIFYNARSGGTSSHFAMYFAATGGTLTVNYNDYYAPGAGGILGYYGGNVITIAALKTATGQDVNSLSTSPAFVVPALPTALNYKPVGNLPGIAGTGIVIDYGSGSRGGTPTMGAWEVNINKWKGTTSVDWNIPGNWTGNAVPAVDADIVFDDVPLRHCQLDQDRSVTDITNGQTAYRMVTNGHKLTVKGNFIFTNNAQIDASSANSNIEMAGVSAQVIPAGTFYNSEVYDLTVANVNNVTLYGTMRLLHTITANSGRLEATANTPTVIYAGTAAQTIESNCFLADKVYNLGIDNVSGVALANTAAITVPHDLTITKGILTVPPGALLTVDNYTKLDYKATVPAPNQVDYWSCLVLKSNATSTGSFIHSDLFTGIGTVKVERFMSKSNNWHLYSSPVKDQSVHEFLKYNPEIPDLYNTTVTPNVIIGVGMRDYNTVTDIWNPYVVYAGSSMVAGSIGGGKGFSIRTYNDAQATGSIDATGIPNLNTVNVTLTRSAATTDKGWNCIGNPFTSALNIRNVSNDGFLNAANSGKLEPGFVAVYVWDANNITTSKTTPEYIVINNATSITNVQIGQGFFVKSVVGGGTVSFTKTMQKPSAGLTFKDAVTEWPSLKIIASNQTVSSSTEIKFIPNTTKGLDPGYDAGMLKANPDFSLYSRLVEDDGIDFTLQCLPDQDYDQYEIPIGVDCKLGGELTFTAESVNLPVGCEALLEDRTTKSFTRLDLKDAKYITNVSPGTTGTGRFYLHTSEVISSNPIKEEQPFKVYTIGKTVYVNGAVSTDAQFALYSVNGQLLANFKAESQVENRLDASGLPSGMYVLSVTDKNLKKSVKLIIGQ